jgi:paraquat-inducible protein B
MTDRSNADQVPLNVPEVSVKTRRGFSIVWLVPLVAAVIAGWLAYKTVTEKGPEITISFKTAEGLEAGKTKVKYKDVEVGMVSEVRLSEDLSHIVVTAEMHKDAAPHLKSGTQFWVVRPRLTAGGISGLGTLISGAYVEMDPGAGKSARAFTGLETPPVIKSDVAGRRYLLRADSLGSVSPGSPIYFRGIDVGEVLGYELGPNSEGVLIQVFVKAPHDSLVREGSRFWNASGVNVTMGADGVRVQTESVQALLTGGIAFDTPFTAMQGEPSAEGSTFTLFNSFGDIGEASYTLKVPYLLHFDGSVRGLQRGAPVDFRGIKLGTVTDIRLEIDRKAGSVRIPVTIELEPQRITQVGSLEGVKPYDFVARLVERGLRAQLKSGNLLTGQLFVALDFYPDSPPAKLERGGKYPEIPTVPTELEEMTRSVNGVLDKFASLPLDAMVKDVSSLINETRSTVRSVEGLVTSPDMQQSLKALRATMEAAQGTMTKAEATLASADGMIGADSQIRYDLTQLMKELTEAARSIRLLASYLERHPDALIRGKAGGGGHP